MLSRYFIVAAASVLIGLLLSRKRGPFGIFRAVKNFSLFRSVTKCETCTTLWTSFILYGADVLFNYEFHYFGFNPNWNFLLGLLAVGGLSLLIASIAQGFVMHDPDNYE